MSATARITNLTIADFCDHIGGERTLHDTLRYIDKYNLEHVWLVLPDGTRLYYWVHGLNSYDPQTRIKAVGAGCIASWDGIVWETSSELPFTSESVIDVVRGNVLDAYHEYRSNASDSTTDSP